MTSFLKSPLCSLPHLTEEENSQLNSALVRLRQFCVCGREHGLHLLVDAEYTYMNRGISAFALAMMVAFNTVSATFTQSQCCPSSSPCPGQAPGVEHVPVLPEAGPQHDILGDGGRGLV